MHQSPNLISSFNHFHKYPKMIFLGDLFCSQTNKHLWHFWNEHEVAFQENGLFSTSGFSSHIFPNCKYNNTSFTYYKWMYHRRLLVAPSKDHRFPNQTSCCAQTKINMVKELSYLYIHPFITPMPYWNSLYKKTQKQIRCSSNWVVLLLNFWMLLRIKE